MDLGSGPAAALPGAAPAAAANAAAESPEHENNGQEADPEDEDEDGNQSLSIGNQPQSQSQAPGSQTGNQLTSQSQAPSSRLSIQVASTIATPQGSRTFAATSFLTTVAPYNTSSILVSNMTITPCPTCTACPGFQVNVAAPPSNSTSEDDNDDGDDDDDIDDDSNDGDGTSKKRALARRFYRQKRETPLIRNWVGSKTLQCYVPVFTRKPAYRKYYFQDIPMLFPINSSSSDETCLKSKDHVPAHRTGLFIRGNADHEMFSWTQSNRKIRWGSQRPSLHDRVL